MKCIYCDYEDSKVIDSRYVAETNSVRRRRECPNCHKRWTTYENCEMSAILVSKKNGSVQPFNKEKITNSIIKSCEKRPVSLDEIEDIATSIEKAIKEEGLKQVYSRDIGELVLEKLKKIDEISYLRYALVLYNFETIDQVKDFMGK